MTIGLLEAETNVVARGGHDRSALENLSDSARLQNFSVVCLLADVADESDCQRVVEATLGNFERIDILVNNAGRGMRNFSEDHLTKPVRFWEADPATRRSLRDTNVNGAFLMAKTTC